MRWHYRWTVDGQSVHDVTICSRGDYLAAPADGTVACRVSMVGSAGESPAVSASE